MRKIVNIFAIVLLFISLSFMLFVSFSPVKTIQLLKVMSGSMEPNIKTGSLVLVKSINPEDIKEGDVITFNTSSPQSPITHRIVKIEQENGSYKFITKGDANNNADIDKVSEDQLVGRVVVSTPYMGYVSNWTKTPIGFIFMIIVPAIIIIINEIFSLRSTVKKEIDKKVQESKPVGLLGMILLIGIISFTTVSTTYAYFSDGEIMSNNIFATAETFPTPSVPPTPTPTGIPCDSCCGGSVNAEISGNGAGSTNEIDINVDCDVDITQENNTDITNNVNLSADSSNGSAKASSSIENNLNNNTVN